MLALSLAVPTCLAGLVLAVRGWVEPVMALGEEIPVVAVLLHPRMGVAERAEWIDVQRERHPTWRVDEIPPDRLAERLTHWFPYLEDLLEEEGAGLLPPLVEIAAADATEVEALLDSPAVIAVGPRTSLRRTLGLAASSLTWALAGLSGVLLIAAAMLAALWVHLELYRHADELEIMRLVGATEGTAAGPFLFSVIAPGILAAAVAAAGTIVAAGQVSRITVALGLPPLEVPAELLVLEIAAAVLLPGVVAFLTVARNARRIGSGGK